jgi:hypothetical protein
MEEVVPQLLVSCAFGGVCAVIAQQRGRSAIGWFVIGFLLSCIGIVILLVLPDLNQEEARRRRLHLENRRLREQVRKDRHVADTRYAEVHRRLGSHDQLLGTDTAPPTDASPELLPGAAPAESDSEPRGERWWWVEDGERRGPVSFDELRRLWLDGALETETLVWRSGMDDWEAIADVRDLAERLGG